MSRCCLLFSCCCRPFSSVLDSFFFSHKLFKLFNNIGRSVGWSDRVGLEFRTFLFYIRAGIKLCRVRPGLRPPLPHCCYDFIYINLYVCVCVHVCGLLLGRLKSLWEKKKESRTEEKQKERRKKDWLEQRKHKTRIRTLFFVTFPDPANPSSQPRSHPIQFKLIHTHVYKLYCTYNNFTTYSINNTLGPGKITDILYMKK